MTTRVSVRRPDEDCSLVTCDVMKNIGYHKDNNTKPHPHAIITSGNETGTRPWMARTVAIDAMARYHGIIISHF